MLRLYDNRLSGNGYKPRLLLARVADQPGHVPMDPAPEGIVDPAGVTG